MLPTCPCKEDKDCVGDGQGYASHHCMCPVGQETGECYCFLQDGQGGAPPDEHRHAPPAAAPRVSAPPGWQDPCADGNCVCVATASEECTQAYGLYQTRGCAEAYHGDSDQHGGREGGEDTFNVPLVINEVADTGNIADSGNGAAWVELLNPAYSAEPLKIFGFVLANGPHEEGLRLGEPPRICPDELPPRGRADECAVAYGIFAIWKRVLPVTPGAYAPRYSGLRDRVRSDVRCQRTDRLHGRNKVMVARAHTRPYAAGGASACWWTIFFTATSSPCSS